MPGVTIGKGAALIAAGVATRYVPPMAFVQGNPARNRLALLLDIRLTQFNASLRPLEKRP